MRKQMIWALVLIMFSAGIAIYGWPAKVQSGTYTEIDSETADECRSFIQTLLEHAQKGRYKKFAMSSDMENPNIPSNYALLKHTRLSENAALPVKMISGENNVFFIQVDDRRGGSYNCVVGRSEDDGGWKFLGVYDE